MVSASRRLARLVAATALLCAAGSAGAACDDLLPASKGVAGPVRLVTIEDLARLRDVTIPDASLQGEPSLAVSPDGSEVAFVLSRAEPEENHYCRALVVAPVARGARPRILDRGGEFIMLRIFARGLSAAVGAPLPVTPAWSPDGRRIAYLRRDGGVTQAWIAASDGSGASAATRGEADVESVAWTKDGSGLLFSTRPGAVRARAAIEREGRSGWLFDDRVATNSGPRPQIRETDAPVRTFLVDLGTGATRPARAGEIKRLEEASEAVSATHPGRRAWTAPAGKALFGPRDLWATASDGATALRCEAPQCRGIVAMWWEDGGKALRFQRREGWRDGVNAFYRWVPGAAPVRLFASEDEIRNCVPARSRLVCTIESSAQPPRIVLLDPASGKSRLIFDPNPEFRWLKLGSVQRLRVRSGRGLPAWVDLVLPPDHKQGARLPMIVVQYRSRGFLRGGTGDEYPIHALAARGFAVLSFERPPPVSSTIPNLRTSIEVNAADVAGWAERWNKLSAIEHAVSAAVATGKIDPARVGITGLSDGATSVRFALINSKSFAAAALSSCCIEPKTAMTYAGIRFAEFSRAIGFPPATADNRAFWLPMSIALNAARIDTPLLMQLSDDEFVLALEAFQALREHGKPVEMYVFPGEHHIKWQPAHRLAVYRRNVDWFDFWLRCREDPAEEKRAQYQRWKALRASSEPAQSLCPS